MKFDDELYDSNIFKSTVKYYFKKRKLFTKLNLTISDLMNMTMPEYDALIKIIPEFEQKLYEENKKTLKGIPGLDLDGDN